MLKPISFLEYSRIIDVIFSFDGKTRFSLAVNLWHNNKTTEKITNNLAEYCYYNENLGKNAITVKRFIDCYFMIDNPDNKDMYIIISPKDLYVMQTALKDLVLPWFFGDKRIFKFDNNGRFILKGKYNPVEIPFSNIYFMRFNPIIIDYADETCKEGIRITINNNNNYIDCDINKFLEFYYYIMNTDILCAAQNMINYIKTPPYGEGLVNFSNNNIATTNNNIGNFFINK